MGFFGPNLNNLRDYNQFARRLYGQLSDSTDAAIAGSMSAADKLEGRMRGTEELAARSLQGIKDYYAGKEFAPTFDKTAELAKFKRENRFASTSGNTGLLNDTNKVRLAQQANEANYRKALGNVTALNREKMFQTFNQDYGNQLSNLIQADQNAYNMRYTTPLSLKRGVWGDLNQAQNMDDALRRAQDEQTKRKIGFFSKMIGTGLGLAFPGAGSSLGGGILN